MFEHKWMLEEDFNSVMDQWKHNEDNANLSRKVSHFSNVLKAWAGSRFSNLHGTIESLRSELNELLKPNQVKNNSDIISQLEHIIDKLVMQEEVHWKQRARANWLSQGDGNTKFFHSFASERKRINHIKGILDDNGQWYDKKKRYS